MDTNFVSIEGDANIADMIDSDIFPIMTKTGSIPLIFPTDARGALVSEFANRTNTLHLLVTGRLGVRKGVGIAVKITRVFVDVVGAL